MAILPCVLCDHCERQRWHFASLCIPSVCLMSCGPCRQHAQSKPKRLFTVLVVYCAVNPSTLLFPFVNFSFLYLLHLYSTPHNYSLLLSLFWIYICIVLGFFSFYNHKYNRILYIALWKQKISLQHWGLSLKGKIYQSIHAKPFLSCPLSHWASFPILLPQLRILHVLSFPCISHAPPTLEPPKPSVAMTAKVMSRQQIGEPVCNLLCVCIWMCMISHTHTPTHTHLSPTGACGFHRLCLVNPTGSYCLSLFLNDGHLWPSCRCYSNPYGSFTWSVIRFEAPGCELIGWIEWTVQFLIRYSVKLCREKVYYSDLLTMLQ